jgi:hypothetical protein
MRAAAHEVEKLATDGLSAAEVDQFFRLAGIMIQNLTLNDADEDKGSRFRTFSIDSVTETPTRFT